MYHNGLGVVQDYVEAIKWYRNAAEHGDAQAQYNLGIMYEKGNGIIQDYIEASEWYRKAALQRNATVQFNLGFMYYFGQGVPRNYVQAYAWISIAASSGYDSAHISLDSIASIISSDEINVDRRLADVFWEQYGNKVMNRR